MKPLALALALLIPLSSLFGCRHSRVAPAEVTDAEYQVLSAYATGKLRSGVGVKQVVILSETLAMTDNFAGTSAVKRAIPKLRKAYGPLFSAFFDVSHHSSKFHRSFTLPVPYQIVDSSEMDSIFGTPGDIWGRYYQKYPGSQGILELSRVGFSPDGQQAAFYLSNRCGGLCGGGYFVVMERQVDSDWKVLQEVQVWIS